MPDGTDASSGNQNKTVRIQSQIMHLLLLADEADFHSRQMGFMDIVLMPKLNGTKSKDPTKWWDSQQINLLTDWDLLSERDVTYWEWCINKRFGTEDQVSSTWLKAFLVGSCSADLVKEVNKQYYKLDRSKLASHTFILF